MGKGKRNKQLQVEERAGAPEKRQNKKQFVMPVWAKRALCIVLLVAVVAGIVTAALLNGGAIQRNRIIVESNSGKFDMNQQMATFVLWYTMYQQAVYEWQNAYYQQYFGGSASSIVTQYPSPDSYGVTMAAYYTKEVLNSGLYSIKDYLIELVAGADAALDAGLKYEAHDKQDAKDVVVWMQNLYLNLGFAEYNYTFDYFLSAYVGDNFKTSDIEDAARVMIMYSKYSDYMNYNFQHEATGDDLQNYIEKNPAGFFESKYFVFNAAKESMIREFFYDKFMDERFESTVAKHFANEDRLAITELKGDALNAKLEELGLKTTTAYTKGEDGKASPELPEAIEEYIFSTSNKAGTFAAVSGEKCAYLIYFEKTSTATEATISYKEYKYEDYKDGLSSIENVKDLIADCIKNGENTTNFETDNEKAADLLAQLNSDTAMSLPEGAVTGVITTKPVVENDTNTAPKSILDVLYSDNADVTLGWNFVVNNDTESYVVKVTGANLKDGEGNETTNHEISYYAFNYQTPDDLFADVLNTFEAEYKLYLLETKVDAPVYKMDVKAFTEKVVDWALAENFQELVLTRYANKELEELLEAKADSNAEKLEEALNTLFKGNTNGTDGLADITKSYATEKEFETKYDSAVYSYIFNTKNKNTASVIVGKNDRVFLVYVAPMATGEEGHEGHDHTKTVHVAIKEFIFSEYEEKLVISGDEATNTFAQQIRDDLLKEGRKNNTAFKAAEDLAKEELDALKKTTDTKAWPADLETVKTYKPAKESETTVKNTNTAPDAIIDKIYPNGTSTTKVNVAANTYYQVDDNGTSYVVKVLSISDDSNLTCEIQYQTFEDEEYYSYFRGVKNAFDSSFKEEHTDLKYPSSITAGSYQDWLFKSEYTDGSRVFERESGDLTFIAAVDSKNNVTSLSVYIVDEPVKQVNDETDTIYAGYQLFETEKDAQKALKKLGGKTGFALLDLFSSLKITEEMGKNNEEGYYPGYIVTTSPTIGLDLTKTDITDDNLEAWLFSAERKDGDVEIIANKDGTGYYLALFSSGEQAWLRNARTGWTEEKFSAHMEDVIAKGGYEFNEDAMSKIEGVITTTTAPATTTKP